MRVEIDRAKCSGMGICEAVAPKIFEVRDDGQTHLLVDHCDDEDIETVRAAVADCPTMALSLVEQTQA